MGRRDRNTSRSAALSLASALTLALLPGVPARASADALGPIRQVPPPYAHEQQEPTGFLNLGGGVFDPAKQPGNGFYGTIATGGEIKQLDLGVQLSWYHHSSSSSSYTTTTVGPGGAVVQQTILANQYDSDLLPLWGIARLRFPMSKSFQPYVGGGAGYEWLTITTQGATAYDPYGNAYYTNVHYTYGGFGGMALGGVNIGVSQGTGLYAEAEYNWSTVSADHYDPAIGYTVRESINMDGLAVQGGLKFRF